MNFSDRITFVLLTDSYYDVGQGRYIEGNPIKVTVPCKLSNLGIDRTRETFGSVDREILVAYLQRPYLHDFDYVEIEEERYEIENRSDYRKGVLFMERIRNVNRT